MEGFYPYLVVDAEYEKVRRGGRVISYGVLIVMGINADGFREILDVRIAHTESDKTHSDPFGDLKIRGLSGIQLVTSEENHSIKAAACPTSRGPAGNATSATS